MRVLGIIPARGGSKGIPGKNIIPVHGKPLISYTIETLKASTLITDFVVSTDSVEIAAIAKNYGANVIKRSSHLATDESNVVDTVLEILKTHKGYDAVLLAQVTSPLRTSKDIDNSIELLSNNDTDAVISVIKVEDEHPARMYTINNESLIPYLPNLESNRRQELPEIYLRNGCIYLVKTTTIKSEKTMIPKSKLSYVMDARWNVNLDTPLNLDLLKIVMPQWKESLK